MEFELPIENLERRKTMNNIDEIKNGIEDLYDYCQPADVYYRSTEQPWSISQSWKYLNN